MSEGRWPPTYDAKGLSAQIRAIAEREAIEKWLFASAPVDGWCQGDLLASSAPLPYLNGNFKAAARGSHALWVLLSNTCDLDRGLGESLWAAVARLVSLGLLDDSPPTKDQEMRAFKTARRVFWPHWPPYSYGSNSAALVPGLDASLRPKQSRAERRTGSAMRSPQLSGLGALSLRPRSLPGPR
jgi:hypothetical protein